MAQAPKKKTVLLTPRFRVSFPEVFTKRAFSPDVPGRYSVVALFLGFQVVDGVTKAAAPANWTQGDKDKWNAILAACNKVAMETFKKPMGKLDRGIYKLPYHRGEEKTYSGYGPGVVYFTLASTKRRPQILDRDGNSITADNSDEFYAGCYARASVNPYAFQNIGKGIAIGLGNLQKLDDGDRLDAFTNAEDDFGDSADEYGADSGDDAMGGGDFEDDPTA